jgi:hypothetical protein
LKQYERIGHRTLDIDYLKRIFEITTEYPLFANFYQKVIEPAERDINQHTDITITKIGKVKRGKKVESLRFEFQRKDAADVRRLKVGQESGSEKPTQTPLSNVAAEPTDSAQLDTLFLKYQAKVVTEFGVSPTVFLSVLAGKTAVDIEKAIRITEGGRADGKVKNMAGFFVEALRQNFTNPVEEKKLKQKQKADNQKRIAELHDQIEKRRDREADEIFIRIKEMTSERPEITDAAIEAIRSHPFKRKVIDSREEDLKRPLTTQDFRDDKSLRQMVLEAIFEREFEYFSDITQSAEADIRVLQTEIQRLVQ